MQYPIIGCLGRARAGKGTLASIITDWARQNGCPSQIISFADPIKDFLTTMVGDSRPFRGNDQERNSPLTAFPWRSFQEPILAAARRIGIPEEVIESGAPTGRQLMQVFGTDIMRNQFYDRIWIQIAANRAKQFAGITIVDDVRFPNEALPPSAGGFFTNVYKLTRASVPKLDHASETAVDLVPAEHIAHTFANDYTIAHMAEDAQTLLNRTFYPICQRAAG
jgi:hypothetical protein